MLTCPSCGQQNPDGARFCNSCAAPLAGETPPRREERKVVTVLFADLVGFTARAERLDPEDVRALLAPYHARLRSELERFGGTVEKFIGDAVMAVFGAPTAREDDPERAVRAALAIRAWIGEQGEDLQARIAVNTGEALVTLGARPSEGEAVVAGDVVNTAVRMEAAAPVNGILVGEQTQRATAHMIDYRQVAPVAAKGKSAQIRVWEALQARSRYGVDVDHAARAPLVGRERELDALQDSFARARSQRAAQLVTLVGVPGIGKSRLVYELAQALEAAEELVTWRQGRCLPYGEGVSFWALGEMVKAQAGILESDGPEEAKEKVEQAVDALAPEAERRWVASHVRTLVGLGGDEAAAGRLAESFAAWRGFVEALADQRPLVLVFEDVHWADDGLLDFIDELVDRSTGAPLLVLCTARPELLERRSGWGGGKANALTISLPPLADEETARLVAVLLERPLLAADTQEELLAKAGGNPLYAEQYARMLLERGALEEVPETVQGIIAARLDALSQDEKALLQNAAVVGKVFWLGAVEEIDGLTRGRAGELLHALERKEFVQRARRSSVAAEAEYAFRHVLLRDVAYAQIPRAARAEKHRLSAEWIESLGRPEDQAELLAHHYVEALQYSRAAGTAAEAAELAEKCARSLLLAGDRAFRLDAGKADSYYARALELLPGDDPLLAEVLAKRAETSTLTARLVEAERLFEQAIAAFGARNDPLSAGQAMVRLANTVWERGATARSRELLAEAVELLEHERAGPELARAYAGTAKSFMVSANAREALNWSEKALPLVERFGLDDLAVRVRQFRGVARWDLGDVGGLEDLREALRMGLDLGLGFETSTAYVNLANFVWLTDGPAQALELERAGIDFAERRGMPDGVLWGQGETLWLLFDLGEWEVLLALADELIERDCERGGSQVGVSALMFKAQVLIRRGRVDEAASLKEDFFPRARGVGDPQILGPALAISALIEQARGDSRDAVRLIDELVELTRERDPWHRTRFAPDAARILAAAGAGDSIAKLRLDETGVVGARPLSSLLAARAVLAEARGEQQQAADLYGDAAERWADYGFVLERGLALLGLGRCLLGLGRPSEATTKLNEAQDVLAGLQAGPLVTETEVLLEQAGASGEERARSESR